MNELQKQQRANAARGAREQRLVIAAARYSKALARWGDAVVKRDHNKETMALEEAENALKHAAVSVGWRSIR